ncbi:MAG: undecaprenyldiphospho-muramoylpentapeptide beta-N-acetylglucosaminyltransferase [Ideonella sp.]|jgi:UDP-N-acetylglucosamine--N-acetylmuramyl-(pentapeptide) pyrophosphoryl-undecaprenol N-acetylglucosamine transferase|nr:undecaprenyldiphospho-muramoylpentapeptide beta-N-acetylglucosaminyltransferase [Ideonella sp.]
MSARHLVVMAAGTGGHVIPGLAIAREMLARGWTVSWLGTTAGMENRLVPPAGLPMDTIAFTGLRGKGLLHTATGGLRLLAAFGACWRILRRRRPAVVLGMGGYVCFPGGLMAALLGRPLALVNADASLLMSNRWLLPVADAITFGFDGEGGQLDKGIVTGNPVRAEIESLAPPEQRFAGRTGPLRVLVVGGSLGARVLNETVPQALAELPAEDRPQVTHQCGAAQVDEATAAYRRAGVDADVTPFIDDMAAALARCDLVVCRAGAVTVSELCAAGVPAVLVPLVVSTTHHQRDNAEWMAGHGAAIHLPQGELTPRRLAGILGELTRAALLPMAVKARALARPRATARIADLVERMAAA